MSWLVPRVSPQSAQAEPSGRTESASDWTFAGAGETSTEADHDPPEGRRAARTRAGVVRASIQAAKRLPDASTPIRGLVCAAVPGSSEILAFAAQAAPPLVSELKKMSALPLRLSCHTAWLVPSAATVMSGKSFAAAVLSVTRLLAAQADPPAGRVEP